MTGYATSERVHTNIGCTSARTEAIPFNRTEPHLGKNYLSSMITQYDSIDTSSNENSIAHENKDRAPSSPKKKSLSLSMQMTVGYHKTLQMMQWMSHSGSLWLQAGQDMPGAVMELNSPYWDSHFAEYSQSREHPRAKVAQELVILFTSPLSPPSFNIFLFNTVYYPSTIQGVNTAVGIPIPGPGGLSGVVVMYSHESVEPNPLLMTVLCKAVYLTKVESFDKDIGAYYDIKNVVNSSPLAVIDWVRKTERNVVESSPVPSKLRFPIINVQLMCKRDRFEADFRDQYTWKTAQPEQENGYLSDFADQHDRSLSGTEITSSEQFMEVGGSARCRLQARTCGIECCGSLATNRSGFCAVHCTLRICTFGS